MPTRVFGPDYERLRGKHCPLAYLRPGKADLRNGPARISRILREFHALYARSACTAISGQNSPVAAINCRAYEVVRGRFCELRIPWDSDECPRSPNGIRFEPVQCRWSDQNRSVTVPA